jgi:hypothetical protein
LLIVNIIVDMIHESAGAGAGAGAGTIFPLRELLDMHLFCIFHCYFSESLSVWYVVQAEKFSAIKYSHHFTQL